MATEHRRAQDAQPVPTTDPPRYTVKGRTVLRYVVECENASDAHATAHRLNTGKAVEDRPLAQDAHAAQDELVTARAALREAEAKIAEMNAHQLQTSKAWQKAEERLYREQTKRGQKIADYVSKLAQVTERAEAAEAKLSLQDCTLDDACKCAACIRERAYIAAGTDKLTRYGRWAFEQGKLSSQDAGTEARPFHHPACNGSLRYPIGDPREPKCNCMRWLLAGAGTEARLRDAISLAKHAINGWACHAKTNREHDSIARLHKQVDALTPAAPAASRGEASAPTFDCDICRVRDVVVVAGRCQGCGGPVREARR